MSTVQPVTAAAGALMMAEGAVVVEASTMEVMLVSAQGVVLATADSVVASVADCKFHSPLGCPTTHPSYANSVGGKLSREMLSQAQFKID